MAEHIHKAMYPLNRQALPLLLGTLANQVRQLYDWLPPALDNPGM